MLPEREILMTWVRTGVNIGGQSLGRWMGMASMHEKGGFPWIGAWAVRHATRRVELRGTGAGGWEEGCRRPWNLLFCVFSKLGRDFSGGRLVSPVAGFSSIPGSLGAGVERVDVDLNLGCGFARWLYSELSKEGSGAQQSWGWWFFFFGSVGSRKNG